MNNSNLAEKLSTEDFTEWEYLATETARVFNLTKNEAEILYNSNTAKIIAAIPFAANCKEPERTAITRLKLKDSSNIMHIFLVMMLTFLTVLHLFLHLKVEISL